MKSASDLYTDGGLACQRFGLIFQRPRGMFIGANDRGRIGKLLANWPYPAKLIVATDERILPRRPRRPWHGHPGRQAAYSACASIHPGTACPSCWTSAPTTKICSMIVIISACGKTLDWRGLRRTRGRIHHRCARGFPGVLIQFEDFANHSAFRLLHKYRDEINVFNDDIQGTAAVALAGLFSALRVNGGKLADQRVLFRHRRGATGIADLVVSAMMVEGLSEAAALKRTWLVDRAASS
jgi:malate dehydrogenase (oxaloacetate-decarboxylating)(NADP+)